MDLQIVSYWQGEDIFYEMENTCLILLNTFEIESLSCLFAVEE